MRTSFILICSGIIFGAFGAHGLRDVLTDYQKVVYEKAVFYQLITAVALLALSQVRDLDARIKQRAERIITIGVIIFSSTLYALAISGIKIFGAITPIGGVLMIAGWGYLAVKAPRS